MAVPLILPLIILSLLSISSAIPSDTVLDAIDVLYNSSFVSMALILENGYQTLLPETPYLTLFSPPDSAFIESGQPTLSLLQFHFSPRNLSADNLRSLSFGDKIPTLLTGYSLIVTSSSYYTGVALNGVTISGSPIYDSGFLVIFGTDRFFDPQFRLLAPISTPNPITPIPTPIVPIPTPSPSISTNTSDLGCTAVIINGERRFSGNHAFGDVLRNISSRNFSVLSPLLDLQLLGFNDQTTLTIFAPIEQPMQNWFTDFRDYPSMILRHVVPCKISLADLVNFDGMILSTFAEEFSVKITRSGSNWMVNDARIVTLSMYENQWLVVHSISKIFKGPEKPKVAGRNPGKIPRKIPDYEKGENNGEINAWFSMNFRVLIFSLVICHLFY